MNHFRSRTLVRDFLIAAAIIAQSTGVTVPGSITFHEDAATPVAFRTRPPDKPSQIRVILARPNDGELLAKVNVGLLPFETLPGATVGDDGRFTIEGLTPGTYFVHAAFVVQPWKLSSAIYDGRDIAESGLTVVDGRVTPGDLKLSFSDRPPTILGEVQLADGRPATSCSVVIFPQNQVLRAVAGSRLRITSCRPDGKYTMPDLLPGHYFLAATVDMLAGRLQLMSEENMAYLEQISRSALKIAPADGQRLLQNLVVSK